MAASISILGNTGGDAELRYSDQGLPIASFSIASNSFRNSPEGKVQITEWFKVTAFGKVAETLAAHVKKGTSLLVLGKLTFNPWLTNNQEPRAGAEVILQSFEFAGGGRNSGYSDTSAEPVDRVADYTGPVQTVAAANGEAPDVTTASDKEPFDNQF